MVACLSANEHDGIGKDTGKVHLHCCASKPSQALLMVAYAAWKAASTWCEDFLSSLFLCQTAQTGVSTIVLGYAQI
jgi:hypothetical protein